MTANICEGSGDDDGGVYMVCDGLICPDDWYCLDDNAVNIDFYH